MNKVAIFSEIEPLKAVVLHKPGSELENLTPKLLKKLLFDDIPFLKVAIDEHNYFKEVLVNHGVKVWYIEDLIVETLDKNQQLKVSLIKNFIKEIKIKSIYQKPYYEFLLAKNNRDLVTKMIVGTKKDELNIAAQKENEFAALPLPNLLFQRDSASVIGKTISINKMWSQNRRCEALFSELVFKYHPSFTNEISFSYHRDNKYHIEGGDIMVLNAQILIVGVSQRTEIDAVQQLAKNLFNDKNNSFEKVIAIEIPKNRAFMHLDTILTNIDYDKFIVHPLIFDDNKQFKIYEITKTKTTPIALTLQAYLSQLINKPVTLIKCGGDDPFSQEREQWNDGTNVLVLEPGKVIAYDRNAITIGLLEAAGVEVIKIPSSELSRGRGGPRCMAMALLRKH